MEALPTRQCLATPIANSSRESSLTVLVSWRMKMRRPMAMALKLLVNVMAVSHAGRSSTSSLLDKYSR